MKPQCMELQHRDANSEAGKGSRSRVGLRVLQAGGSRSLVGLCVLQAAGSSRGQGTDGLRRPQSLGSPHCCIFLYVYTWHHTKC